jgi:hypothetical protein
MSSDVLGHLDACVYHAGNGLQRVSELRADRFKLPFGRIAEYHLEANRVILHGHVLDVPGSRVRLAGVGVSDGREGSVDQSPIDTH